ncbi:single-stranded-DNA-specific exonuclease RecJ [Nafulsella turpanensis]|uniref:single-stranded-DNA-specific exonuclease RecJ n=1 Tax=Nafulsella turpanensis TaxID=1265690 RepID=UPI00034720C6|nr:single-stranded-DNA-specific exonuclease RecJ [Nafulsella turpanensis]
MTKRWVIKESAEQAVVKHLSEAININTTLAGLLVQRGVQTFEEAKKFFRPSLDDLHDPFLMKDMDRAVERLETALDQGQKVLVYGDYDVDGTTSVALFYGFMQDHYPGIKFYIPDRYKEGYGISEAGIDWAIEEKFDLIISLDCGIKAVNMIGKAAAAGIDFIVCDHHLPGAQLPPAFAVLDPKRPDCSYPFKELSGCGIGFKLLQAFCIKNNIDLDDLYPYLDLVAVSIAADIVPLVGENRILAHFGLQQLNSNPRPGLQALINLAGFKSQIDINSIVFGIGPRINASGRIAHAKTAVKLLLSKDLEEAESIATIINDKNTERRSFDTNITREALEMIEQNPLSSNAKSTVLFKNDWHKGVIGIVASRCIDSYYRPTIILTESNNKATGSARSVVGFDIYEAISECSDLLLQYGGHMYAAGLTMEVDKVEAFQQRFEEVVSSRIRPEQLVPQIEIDQTITLDQVTPRFNKILKQMGPFGPLNMQPVFITENVKATGRPRVLKNKHLKLNLAQEEGGPVLDAIGFDMADYFAMIDSGMRFHIAYTIEENSYWGPDALQLCLKDIKFD